MAAVPAAVAAAVTAAVGDEVAAAVTVAVGEEVTTAAFVCAAVTAAVGDKVTAAVGADVFGTGANVPTTEGGMVAVSVGSKVMAASAVGVGMRVSSSVGIALGALDGTWRLAHGLYPRRDGHVGNPHAGRHRRTPQDEVQLPGVHPVCRHGKHGRVLVPRVGVPAAAVLQSRIVRVEPLGGRALLVEHAEDKERTGVGLVQGRRGAEWCRH